MTFDRPAQQLLRSWALSLILALHHCFHQTLSDKTYHHGIRVTSDHLLLFFKTVWCRIAFGVTAQILLITLFNFNNRWQ